MARDAGERSEFERCRPAAIIDPGKFALDIHEFEHSGENVQTRRAHGGTPAREDAKIPQHRRENLVSARGEVESGVNPLTVRRLGEDAQRSLERPSAGDRTCSGAPDAVAREAAAANLSCDPTCAHEGASDGANSVEQHSSNQFVDHGTNALGFLVIDPLDFVVRAGSDLLGGRNRLRLHPRRRAGTRRGLGVAGLVDDSPGFNYTPLASSDGFCVGSCHDIVDGVLGSATLQTPAPTPHAAGSRGPPAHRRFRPRREPPSVGNDGASH